MSSNGKDTLTYHRIGEPQGTAFRDLATFRKLILYSDNDIPVLEEHAGDKYIWEAEYIDGLPYLLVTLYPSGKMVRLPVDSSE